MWSFTMRGGQRMTAPATSIQTWSAAFTGAYDDECLTLFERIVEAGTYVLDVGACFGFYTIPLARMAERVDALVVAIEPIEANCRLIADNCRANGFGDRVTILNHAVGETDGTVTMVVETALGGSASVVDLDGTDVAGAQVVHVSVEIRPIDHLELPPQLQSRRCSAMKIDVEGFELAALLGAGAFVARHRPVIIGEFSGEWLRARGLERRDVVSWAGGVGYECFRLEGVRRRRFSAVTEAALLPAHDVADDVDGELVLIPAESVHKYL
ncbi:MAG: FkbM family methyltransferase [Acidimicrobiales bacterium]